MPPTINSLYQTNKDNTFQNKWQMGKRQLFSLCTAVGMSCTTQHSINETPRCKLSITLFNKQCEVLRVFGLERRPDMLLSQRGRTLRARKAAFRLLCSLGHAQPQCPTPKHQKFRRFRPIWEPDPARKCSRTRDMLVNPTPLGYHLDQDAWA
jgi:hypothetical protein